jgi:DNA-binding response OmpR family regulator
MKEAILIVDDEFGLADIVAEVLAEEGYDVDVTINGQLGLNRLAEKRYDLVLLDVMMPVLDGPAMLRAMRVRPAFATLPVIMMTALAEALPKDKPPLHQAVLHKPFSPERLLATIQRVLAT